MSELSLGIEHESTTFSGDLSNRHDIAGAAQRIAEGKVVAVDNDSVWALWGDAGNPHFVQQVRTMKNRNPESRFGMTLPFEAVAGYVDLDRVHPGLHQYFHNPVLLTDLVGSLAFVRFPVSRREIARSTLNDAVISYDRFDEPVIQNYDPTGKANVQLLIAEALGQGAILPAASSMNCSGEAEIMTTEKAHTFIKKHSIKDAIADSRASRVGSGSFAILDVNHTGIQLVREGNVSAGLMGRILQGLPYSPSSTCRASAGQPLDGFADLNGPGLRQAIIEARGWHILP